MESILIAGAGPVGLTAALALARAGMRIELFEKRSTPNLASKGSTFHPPTLEILDELGVAGRALREGQRADAIDYYDRRRLAARLELGVLADLTRFPFRLQYEQADMTGALFAALEREPNAKVRLGVALRSAQSTPDGVRAELDSGGSATGAVLIAADGYRSTLRDETGIAFEGTDYASRVLRLSTDEDLARFVPGIAAVAYLYDGERSVSVLKLAQDWRIIFRIDPRQTDESALEDGNIRALLEQMFGAGAGGLRILSKDVYAASRRLAATYRAGRIVLAGDAAHVTNTRGGMNMNCGIHDAYALAGAIIRSRSGASLDDELERYALERRSVAAEQLLPLSHRAVSSEGARLAEMQQVAGDPQAARAYLRSSSLLDSAPPRRTISDL